MYAYNIICILTTLQKNAQQPQLPPPALLRTRCSAPALLRHFHNLLPVAQITGWLAVSEKTFYARAFTPLVTLWYMVFQRLSENHHLSRVQEDAREGGADRLSPRGKPLSAQIHSESTSAYSDARHRLPLELLSQSLRQIARHFSHSFKLPQWFGLQVALVDGTTFRLRPFGDIPRQFAPHRSSQRKRPPYWCLARVVGILCLASGAVLDTIIGPMAQSEQALCAAVLKARSWAGWLLVADRNFGVYSVVRSIAAAQGQALVRLTAVRAGKLARSVGAKLQPGLDVPLIWSPSRHDQCPADLKALPVAGRLVVAQISRPGYRPFMLCLFTTLVDPLICPAEQLVRLYGQRWNIELCFRYIKVQMELGFLEAHSADIARKEWLAGMLAYNLVRWTMAAAAGLAQVPPALLSFCRAHELLLGWLSRSPQHRPSNRSWQRLLFRIARTRQPKRRKPRPSEPRAIRPFTKDFGKLYGSRAATREKLASSTMNS